MTDLKWWQKAVFYQIYPRSFADGNGDGIGDFVGMTGKLDFLQELGIDAVWLSPHFPSPQADCGYDISDYRGVAPEYGTLVDFRRFLDGAHQRAIRVILDLVLNHTSDQHRWFLESRSSLDSPKRDWYIWRDGWNGGPPNNWESGFGGTAWEYDPKTGQYYYHYFLREQPDLNWRNPEVKQAMWDAVRFWLDMGVDGFRLDAISTIYERPDLPDHRGPRTLVELQAAREVAAGPLEAEEEVLRDWEALFVHQVDQPGIHELMQELHAVLDEYDGHRVLVGESEDVRFHGQGDDELDLVFNFPLMKPVRLTPAHIRENQRERLACLAEQCPGAWPCNTLGNHDSPRVKTRFGDGIHDDTVRQDALARLHVALLLTLQGTPFLYNGEEIGMTDYALPDIHQFRDLWGIWNYRAAVEKLKLPPDVALQRANEAGRDKNRTPYQWARAANGGFSPAGVETWLPVNPNWAEGVNAEDQADDPGSLLNFYRELLRVRRNTPVLIAGEYVPLHEDAEGYLAFVRKVGTRPSANERMPAAPPTNERVASPQICLVVLNFSDRPVAVDLSDVAPRASVLFATGAEAGWAGDLSQLIVEPFGVYIGEVL